MKKVRLAAPGHHRDRVRLSGDPDWAVLIRATPDQLDAWLQANVHDAHDVRRVLRLLILAVRHQFPEDK